MGAEGSKSAVKKGQSLLKGVEKGDIALATKLLASPHVDPSIADEEGNTALHSCCYHGHDGLVDGLLKKGATGTSQNEQGNTPMHLAAYRGFPDCLRLLLNHGLPVDAENAEKDSPLHLAVLSKDLAVVKLLVEHKAKPDSQNDQGMTPLHYATGEGLVEAAKVLMDVCPSSIALQNRAGQTPLWLAVHNATEDIFVAVLAYTEATARAVNLPDRKGNTPLHLAARQRKAGAVRLLVKIGADPSLSNAEGLSPRDVALQVRRADISKMLDTPVPGVSRVRRKLHGNQAQLVAVRKKVTEQTLARQLAHSQVTQNDTASLIAIASAKLSTGLDNQDDKSDGDAKSARSGMSGEDRSGDVTPTPENADLRDLMVEADMIDPVAEAEEALKDSARSHASDETVQLPGTPVNIVGDSRIKTSLIRAPSQESLPSPKGLIQAKSGVTLGSIASEQDAESEPVTTPETRYGRKIRRAAPPGSVPLAETGEAWGSGSSLVSESSSAMPDARESTAPLPMFKLKPVTPVTVNIPEASTPPQYSSPRSTAASSPRGSPVATAAPLSPAVVSGPGDSGFVQDPSTPIRRSAYQLPKRPVRAPVAPVGGDATPLSPGTPGTPITPALPPQTPV